MAEAPMRETMARALCLAERLDPDADCFGMGWTMPKGFRGPAWQGRLHQVDAMLDALMSPTLDMRCAGEREVKEGVPHLEHANESEGGIANEVWQAMLRKAKEGG